MGFYTDSLDTSPRVRISELLPSRVVLGRRLLFGRVKNYVGRGERFIICKLPFTLRS